MPGITTGELRLTGGFGIRQILGFSMREYPGEHARAELTGRVEVQEGAMPQLLGQIKNSRVELHAAGEKRAVYSGVVQGAESLEENGYRLLRLELWSGSVLMDLKREKRTFQDPSMTYGQIITGITSEAGMSALYPRELDETETGFPVIQYRETDWEFIRRLASRFGLAVYPEPTMEGGKVSIGLPETGFSGPLSSLSDSVGIDRKFYEAGGERTGRERRNYRTVEVRSLELRRIGDVVEWKGTPLYVCAREGELRGGILEFRYVLAGKEWTWQKRLGNPRVSGMSLLGTVSGCAGETVRLDLDIDRGRAARERYPWTWVPATGNLMYMMPQKGTRVSLYFKGDEETDAIAVNCIRSGAGGAGADYRDKSLITEQGMELRLHRGDMGVVSVKEKVLLDDLEGIRIGGSGGLHILAAGEVKIDGADVRVEGTEGVYLYEGEAKADEEGTVSVTVKGKVELSADEEGSAVHSRGENVTYYLAWEHMDLSHPSNRYRDEPEQKDYDWAKWRMNIVSGVAVAAGVAVLAASGVGFLVGTGVVSVGGATGAVTAAGAAKATGMAVFLTGSLYVAEQAVSDAVSGRLSETEQYARKALAGSVVGFLTGASGLLMQGSGLGKVLALGFGEGFLGSAATQALLNEDGEINWALAFGEGMFSAAVTGMAWEIGGSIKRIEGGSGAEGSENLFSHMSQEDERRYIAWEQARSNGITPDNPDVYVRFGYLLDRGVDYDNAYFLATLDRNIYEAFDEDEIVKLITNVEDYASTLSKRKRNPAIAGVYNKHTGEFFYGTNLKYQNVPELAPQLKKYFENMPLDVSQSYADMTVAAGTHAEILALNDALWADPSASIDDFLVYVMHGNNVDYGMAFPRCPHCQWITQQFYSVYK